MEPNITHLVVWVKSTLEDTKTENLMQGAEQKIESFVSNMFCKLGGIERDDVVWFWNCKGLKTVLAVEHFHVLVHNASRTFLDEITKGDVPVTERADFILNQTENS